MRVWDRIYGGLTVVRKPPSDRADPEWLRNPAARRPSKLELSVKRYLASINDGSLEYEVEESKEGGL